MPRWMAGTSAAMTKGTGRDDGGMVMTKGNWLNTRARPHQLSIYAPTQT